MFWFKKTLSLIDLIKSQFKYIICFGSSILDDLEIENLLRFKYIICFGSREGITYLLKCKIPKYKAFTMFFQSNIYLTIYF